VNVPLHDANLAAILELLRDRAGLDAESIGRKSVFHTVAQRAVSTAGGSLEAYRARLMMDEAEFQGLLEDVVVPETWFFREAAAFRCLEEHARAWRLRGDGLFRVLSVPCSTGEEVYSLVMILRRAGLGPKQCQIVGVDLSRRALDTAREGVYTSRSFREQDESLATLIAQGCDREGDSWRVGEAWRLGVSFCEGNLARGGFLHAEPAYDAIFCRNVLIYFSEEARQIALGNLRRLLKPGGLLCSAAAEARIVETSGWAERDPSCPFAFSRRAEVASPLSRFETSVAWPLQPAPLLGQPIPSQVPRRETQPTLAPERNAAAFSGPHAGALSTAAAVPAAVEIRSLRDAKLAADHGRLDEASAVCREVLRRDPTNAEAYCLQGTIHQAGGNLAEAERCFARAAYLDPSHYQALVHLMLLAQGRGDWGTAANYRRRAAQFAPRENR
jgi:chemotaxis protein methyltransferase WspC